MYYEWIDRNTVRIKIEDEKDLFVLFKIINPGDILEGYDYRTIKFNNKKEKVRVWIRLEVEKIKFSEYGDSLRVSGKILEASEIVTGKYHTFDLRKGTEIILKKDFRKYEIEELERAKNKGRILYVVSLDDRNLCLAKIENYRINTILEFELNIAKEDANRDSVYKQKLSEIIKELGEEKPDIIVVVGPIYYPDIFESYARDKLNAKILKFRVSKGCYDGIREFLRRKEYLDSIKEIDLAEVNKIIQDFLYNMLKGYCVFGLEKVNEYLDMGNLEYILISYKYFKKLKEEGKIEKILSILYKADNYNLRVYFVYEENENFELIDKYGVVGKIRYKIE